MPKNQREESIPTTHHHQQSGPPVRMGERGESSPQETLVLKNKRSRQRTKDRRQRHQGEKSSLDTNTSSSAVISTTKKSHRRANHRQVRQLLDDDDSGVGDEGDDDTELYDAETPGAVSVPGMGSRSTESNNNSANDSRYTNNNDNRQITTTTPTTTDILSPIVAEIAPDTDAVMAENDELRRQLEAQQQRQGHAAAGIIVESVPVKDAKDDSFVGSPSKKKMVCLFGVILILVVGVAVGVTLTVRRPTGVNLTSSASNASSFVTTSPTMSLIPSFTPTSSPTTPRPTSFPSHSPSDSPSSTPSQSVAPSTTPTFHSLFPRKSMLLASSSLSQEDGNFTTYTNLVYSDDGRTLAVVDDSNAVYLWTKDLDDGDEDGSSWSRIGSTLSLEGQPTGYDFTVYYDSSEGTEDAYYTVAVGYDDHVSIHRLHVVDSIPLAWNQLGESFENLQPFTESEWSDEGGYYEGFVTIKLTNRGGGEHDNPVILAISTTRSTENDDFGNTTIYEFTEENQTWDMIGESIPGHEAFSYSPNSISLARDGTVVAIGSVGGIGSGSIRVYDSDSYCGDGTTVWCQLGDEIAGGGDYEDMFGTTIALSSDGERIIAGAPGDPQCGSEACSSAYVYEFSTSASTSRWLSLGRTLQIREDDEYNYPLPGFGFDVDISDDGNTVAIARVNQWAWSSTDWGVYVYSLSQNNDWQEQFQHTWNYTCYDASACSMGVTMDISSNFDSWAIINCGDVTLFHD